MSKIMFAPPNVKAYARYGKQIEAINQALKKEERIAKIKEVQRIRFAGPLRHRDALSRQYDAERGDRPRDEGDPQELNFEE